MPQYQLRIDVRPDKIDEFVEHMKSLWLEFLREEGCSSYRVYREFEKDNIFFIVGEYDTTETMNQHFHGENYELLLGGARVLGKIISVSITDILEQGGYDLGKSKHAGG